MHFLTIGAFSYKNQLPKTAFSLKELVENGAFSNQRGGPRKDRLSFSMEMYLSVNHDIQFLCRKSEPNSIYTKKLGEIEYA